MDSGPKGMCYVEKFVEMGSTFPSLFVKSSADADRAHSEPWRRQPLCYLRPEARLRARIELRLSQAAGPPRCATCARGAGLRRATACWPSLAEAAECCAVTPMVTGQFGSTRV